jgi:nucleoside-diphosphate-sugar epimerase
MSNKLCYITGNTGFVGQNLVKYLSSSSFELRGISREKKADSITYADFFKSNEQYNSIVHLAGKAHDLKKTAAENDYYEVNFELTKKLYDSFLQSDAKTFIYISSVKAVKDIVEGSLTETDEATPVTAYGKSKKMAEEYIMANLRADKRVFILRPCMIHGPGNKGNLNLLYGVVSKGIPYPLAAFHNMRSFLSVENLCFVIEQLLIKDVPSGIYNVADDGALSTNEIIKLISASLNKRGRLIKTPKKLVEIAAGAGSVLRLPLNTERLQKLTENYVVDNSKIKAVLQCDLPLSITEGLTKTFISFRENK